MHYCTITLKYYWKRAITTHHCTVKGQWELANCYCTIAILHYCTGALLEVWSIGGGGSCDHWSRCPCCTVHPSLLIIMMLTMISMRIIMMLTIITMRMITMMIIMMLTMITMRMMSLLILHPSASNQSLPSKLSCIIVIIVNDFPLLEAAKKQ